MESNAFHNRETPYKGGFYTRGSSLVVVKLFEYG